MKNIIKRMLRESSTDVESVRSFYNRFKEKNTNPEFLENSFKNPDFELRLSSNSGVKLKEYRYSQPNRCETNTFMFIKEMMLKGIFRYYPVSGWAFMETTTYFEHFWVYDEVTNLFLDVSPLQDDKLMYAYGGVINRNINDEIKNANSFSDIEFLKGKSHNSLFANHIDKKTNYNFETSKTNDDNDESLLKYVMTNSNYSDVQDYFKFHDLESIKDLKRELGKLMNIRDNVRNNREFDFYTSIISKIEAL